MSIAQGLPIRRSVVKFTNDPIPDGAVTKAVEGKAVDVHTLIDFYFFVYHLIMFLWFLHAVFYSGIHGTKSFHVGANTNVRSWIRSGRQAEGVE